ncbi:tetratricopeptide repeat protein [Chitinophaga sp. GCM10012297]|uniref:Tetratricopeptide repeat protein n=1 Tax=Chitinophaga chungangae TaxID=2821488 RepID=A0ABS3YBH5_9BACT|nr:tetratricopeptide repeat protein [Chitinophaga chungangae]MBO9152014.1 tetratricopeptide repeat protein [Chitinophaga chungangae]
MNQDLYRRAAILVERGKYKEAAFILSDLLAHEPQNPEILDLFSEVKLQTGEPETALEMITSAIGLNPEKDHLFHQRARIHLEKYDFRSAGDDLEEAVRLNPLFAGHFALYALVSVNMQLYRKALELADKALEQDPQNTLAMNARHIAYRQLRYREEAETAIMDAFSHDPENELTHANKGWSLLEQKKPREALAHFREALRINPSYGYALAGMKLATNTQYWPYRALRAFTGWLQSSSELNKNLVPLSFLLPLTAVFLLSLKYKGMQPYWMMLVFTILAIFSTHLLYVPVWNFFMLMHAGGKQLLTKKETAAARLAGSCLLTGLLGLAGYLVALNPLMLAIYMVFISLLLPLHINISVQRGKMRKYAEAVVSIALGISVMAAAVVMRDTVNLFTLAFFAWTFYLRLSLMKRAK